MTSLNMVVGRFVHACWNRLYMVWWTNRLEQRCWNHHNKSIAMFIHDRITCCQGMMNSQGWTAMLYNNHEHAWHVYFEIFNQITYTRSLWFTMNEISRSPKTSAQDCIYTYTFCTRSVTDIEICSLIFFYRLPIAIAPCTDNNNCEQVCFTNISSNQQECSCNPGFKPRSDDNTKCDGK